MKTKILGVITLDEVNDLSGSRILILGCGGFIGSHLLDQVLSNPSIQVEGWDTNTGKITHLLNNPNFRLVKKTMHEPGVTVELGKSIANADMVINLAAICNPSEYNTRPIQVIYSNFIDSYPMVELCAMHNKWLIHYSTSEVYGRTISSYISADDYSDPGLYELKEDSTPLIMGPVSNQRWSYASAKQLLERFVYAHHQEHDMPFTIVRPLNFFGPRMDYLPGRDGEGVPRVLACFMSALIDNKPIQLVDGGTARRTIVSIRDAIRALLLMLTNPEKAQNEIFNIGNRGNEVTMAELAQLMREIYAEVAGDRSYLKHPIKDVSSLDFYGEGYEDCDRRMPDVENATSLLGWTPKYALRETLWETVNYYYHYYSGSPMTPMKATMAG